MIFIDRSGSRKLIGKPVAVIFDKMAGMFGKTLVESCFLGHFWLRIWRGTKGHGALKIFLTPVGAHVNIGRVPAICRRGVIRAGRADADQIGQRPHQHIVPGTRPGFVRAQLAMFIKGSVEKEIDCHPSSPRGDTMVSQRMIEIVRTIDMPRIADVIIIFGRTGKRKGIMASTGVLNHLNERNHVLVIIFGVQTGHRVG